MISRAEATYPERAKRERLEASVVLRLTVDAQGAVVDALVTHPAGYGFDEAAREAALRFRFQPAERQGLPVAARILFRYDFELPPEPAPAPQAAAALAPRAASAASPAAAPSPPPRVEITVVGAPSDADALQQSAEAVNVVETRRAKRQSADLGEVLARTQGVSVRRDGGLGSDTKFSLNGLTDAQIRFFLDGIPLELAGYPFGLANVPVNLVSRVEVYRGVVPIRFGADALGGAVNMVSDRHYETHASASYQVGSFGTHRLTANGRYRHEPTGVVLGATAFFDVAQNNYDVDVQTANERGRLFDVTVPRFHDAYRAQGVTLEAGIFDRPWAKRLLLQAFYSGYDKELQHNVVMTIPYGEVKYGETVYGSTARFDVAPHPRVELELVGSYAHRIIDWSDESTSLYDWYGRPFLEHEPETGGEVGGISGDPSDQTTWQDSVFARGIVTWEALPRHVLRASLTPTVTARTGDERLQTDPELDLLTAQHDVFTLVSGLEYQLDLFDDRLSNVVFLKDYYYDSASKLPTAGGGSRTRNTVRHFPGAGDSLRFRFTPWLYAKASYEYGTRLPTPDEVFGNGATIRPNLELEPENSHNANVGPRVELQRTGFGDFTLDVNAFLRETKDLIVVIGAERNFSHANVFGARGIGLDTEAGWTSPGRYIELNGTLSWQDVRNSATEGTFGNFEGDRLPNRPYLFGSWGANLRFAGMPGARDSIEPFYNGRYVHGFYRGWESLGQPLYKMTVDTQVTHGAGVSWSVNRDVARVTSTLEVDNFTDAKVFDNFGVQRPGRAYYLKMTAEL